MSAIPRDTPEYATPTFLDRALNLSQINLEVVAFGLLIVLSVIAHLGIMTAPTARVTHPVWYEKTEVLRAPVAGVWRPVVDKMHSVAADALIGRIVDPFGNVLREVRAPFAGEMLYVVATPPVSEGEPLGMIAAVQP